MTKKAKELLRTTKQVLKRRGEHGKAAEVAKVLHGTVRYFEAKPNNMFPAQITMLLRFAETSQPIKCAYKNCTHKRKKFWTMLCPFSVMDTTNVFILETAGTFEPLSLVCRDHFLTPTKPILKAIQGGE